MQDKGNNLGAIAALTLIGLVILATWWIGWHNYKECRANGFSVLYCGTRK